MQIAKYRKDYIVKSYEVDCNGFMRIVSLMNLLQEMASENAEILGFGYESCHAKNLAWVGSNYLLLIDRLPVMEEHISVETWPAEGKLWGAIRNFTVKDSRDNIIMRVKSQWVLIDIERRRPVALSKHFPEYNFLNEQVMDKDFSKITDITAPDSVKEFLVRYDDIDLNNHVNNSVYPLWASEAVDYDFRKSHIPQELEICFKKEALLGETVQIMSIFGDDSETIHTIRDKKSAEELAQCRIKWRKITSE